MKFSISININQPQTIEEYLKAYLTKHIYIRYGVVTYVTTSNDVFLYNENKLKDLILLST